MDDITQVQLLWFAVGIGFILLEFTAIPGIGFLFLGLGSLTSATLMYYFPDLESYQVVAIGLCSLAWFLLLWWPLKRFVYGAKGGKRDYFDIVGMQVEVAIEDIEPSGMGQVYWSGTIMNAKMDAHDREGAKVGDMLYVVEVRGNIMICTHKKPAK